MDYGRFVAERQHDWDVVHERLGEGVRRLDYEGLEDFAARYRHVVADFAFVRTRFPDSEAERRLRGLVLRGHRVLSAPGPTVWTRLVGFFRTGFPARFRASLPAIRVSLALFAGGFLLGLVLTTLKDDAAALFVGAEGVEMVRRGEIWTDQLSRVTSSHSLAAQIFTNNISVAVFAWAGGALFGLGSVWCITFNGGMVGSLVALCLRYGMEERLFAFIPAHGFLELFLIVVAGAAGLELAAGAIAPGPNGRLAGFGEGARRSIELVGGTVPWFVLLGIVEGYLSPLMDLPTSLKVGLGVLLLVVFLGYVSFPPRRAA